MSDEKKQYIIEAANQADADATELAEFEEGVPVDPEVAEHMGAFSETALLFEEIDQKIIADHVKEAF